MAFLGGKKTTQRGAKARLLLLGLVYEILRQGLGGLHTELAEAVGLTDQRAAALAELAQRLIVGSGGGANGLADIFERGYEPDELVVELGAAVGYFQRVAALRIAFPEVVHDFEQGEQVGRR